LKTWSWPTGPLGAVRDLWPILGPKVSARPRLTAGWRWGPAMTIAANDRISRPNSQRNQGFAEAVIFQTLGRLEGGPVPGGREKHVPIRFSGIDGPFRGRRQSCISAIRGPGCCSRGWFSSTFWARCYCPASAFGTRENLRKWSGPRAQGGGTTLFRRGEYDKCGWPISPGRGTRRIFWEK